MRLYARPGQQMEVMLMRICSVMRISTHQSSESSDKKVFICYIALRIETTKTEAMVLQGFHQPVTDDEISLSTVKDVMFLHPGDKYIAFGRTHCTFTKLSSQNIHVYGEQC